MAWDDDQDSERDWWGDCANTFGEETKQLVYAKRMGLTAFHLDGHWPVFELGGRSVLDVGGGPCSMLLKCVGRTKATVVDPCPYPSWVAHRYQTAGTTYLQQPAEKPLPLGHDEAWIYNVLQHVQDPGQIIRNMQASAPVIRIFEWINIPPHQGHPHMLQADQLDQWLGGTGHIEQLNENECEGIAYSGVFPS